jgi:hypothetical protein
MKPFDNGSEEIEKEENENVNIKFPFNPNDVKITNQPLTLGQLVDMLENKEIKLDTEFQRRTDLWGNKKKSQFIESLLLRLPIPTFYFDANDNNLWRVIDGLQRISTIKSFVVDKKLILEDLEFLTNYNGKKYDELPRDMKRRINTFPITAHVLEKGTPDNVKYNIFKRINQGGLVLTPQEIRHALHQGIPADFIADLVRGEDETDGETGVIYKVKTKEGMLFVRVTGAKISPLRMEDRDFATRFVAFYLQSYNTYEPDLDSFMNKGMSEINKKTPKQLQQLRDDFYKAMYIAWKIFEVDAFRKRFKKETQKKHPINKALFEVLSVNFAKFTEAEMLKLISLKEFFKDKLIELHNQADGAFLRSISQGTAQKDSVIYRFKSIEKIIQETLNHDN